MTAATLLFGINYWVAKGLMPDFMTPFQVIFVRVAGAALLFSLLQAGIPEIRNQRIGKKDMARLALASLLGVAINQIMFFAGLNHAAPVDAAIINSVNPVLVLVFASLLLHVRITGPGLTGILLGAAGTVLLIVFGGNADAIGKSRMGNSFILINTVSYSLYLVIAKPVMVKYNPVVVMKWMFLFGLGFILPVTAGQALSIHPQTFTPTAWFSIIYVVLATTFMAYLLITFAMKRLSPPVVAYYSYVQPVLVAMIGVFMMGENLSWIKIASTLLVFCGIYLVTRKLRKDA
jgi:drug/metabolite transporter (DMT)-like permease